MSTATQMVLFMPILVGFGALAVDVAWLRTTQAHLQDVTDAAALAGVSALGDADAVLRRAQTVGSANMVAGHTVRLTSTDVTIGTWSNGAFNPDVNGNAVRVSARQTGVASFLGGVFGANTYQEGAMSIAARVGGSGGSFPCGMYAQNAIQLNGRGHTYG